MTDSETGVRLELTPVQRVSLARDLRLYGDYRRGIVEDTLTSWPDEEDVEEWERRSERRYAVAEGHLAVVDLLEELAVKVGDGAQHYDVDELSLIHETLYQRLPEDLAAELATVKNQVLTELGLAGE